MHAGPSLEGCGQGVGPGQVNHCGRPLLWPYVDHESKGPQAAPVAIPREGFWYMYISHSEEAMTHLFIPAPNHNILPNWRRFCRQGSHSFQDLLLQQRPGLLNVSQAGQFRDFILPAKHGDWYGTPGPALGPFDPFGQIRMRTGHVCFVAEGRLPTAAASTLHGGNPLCRSQLSNWSLLSHSWACCPPLLLMSPNSGHSRSSLQWWEGISVSPLDDFQVLQQVPRQCLA